MIESSTSLHFCTICHGRSEDDPEREFTHEQCNQILKNIIAMDDEAEISANIYLAYYKQGADLYSSYKNCRGDIAAAFENLAQNFEGVVRHLRDITDGLKEANPKDLTLVADTHVIILTGPKRFLLPLITKEIATLDIYGRQ